MSTPFSLLSSTAHIPTSPFGISGSSGGVGVGGNNNSNGGAAGSGKLQPKILCGKLHRDNRFASDWGWQNLFAYGCHTHVAVVDPAFLHVVQTLDEHRHNVCAVRWSLDIHCSAQNTSVRLATADTGGTVIIWDVVEASVLQSFNVANDIQSTSPSSTMSAISSNSSNSSNPAATNSSTSNTSSSSSSFTSSIHTIKDIQWMQHDPNLMLILTGSSLYLWNLHSGTRIWRKDIDSATAVQLDPFIDNRLLIGTTNGSIYSCDLTHSIPSGSTNDMHTHTHTHAHSLTGSVQPPVLEFVHHASPLKGAVAVKGEMQQMVCSPIARNIVYYVFNRELIVYDISSTQVFGSVLLERNKSNFQSIIVCRENPYLMFSLHEDGCITSWNRRTDNNFTYNYEQLCVSDLSHFHKKSKKKGQQLFSITNHPYNEQTLLSIAGDGIIWKWDFTSEILNGGQSLFAPRLNSLSLKPLNGVVKLGVSGTSDCVSHPISSMSVYPFANRANMSLIVVGTVNGTIQLLNATTLRVQKELFIWQHPVFGLRWLSPGRVICYSYEEVETGRTFNNRMAMVDLRSGRVKEFRLVATNEPTPIRGLRLSFSRKFLVILLKDRPFELWETKKFTCLRSFKQYPSVAGLEWVPPRDDSETSLSPDISRYETREQFIFFNSDGPSSIKCCTIEGSSVTLVDMVMEGNTLANVMSGTSPQLAHALKRDLLVAGDAAGGIHVWSSEKKRHIANISTHKSSIKKIRFSPAPNATDILVLFTSGEISIFDLSTGTKTATGSYLSERDIKAIDIEWLTDANPIVISADNSIRILDNTLCLMNSRINNVIGSNSSSSGYSIFEGFLYSPLLLSPFCAMQLKHLLHGCRLASHEQEFQAQMQQSIDLGKSQASSLLFLDQLEKNTRLMSLVDDRLVSLLSSSNVPECSLAIAQFFGDYKQIKFWRLVIYALQTIDKSVYTPGHSVYSQECLEYYDQLPLIPPIPTKSVNDNQTQLASSSTAVINHQSPSIGSNISSNAPPTSILIPNTINISSNISPMPTSPLSTPTKSTPPPPIDTTPTLSKKQSIASFFGGFAQGFASKGNAAKDKEVAKTSTIHMSPSATAAVVQPLAASTTIQQTSINTSSPATNTNTSTAQSITNPLSTSQAFHSVASQLQQSQIIDFDTLQATTTTTTTTTSGYNSPLSSSLADSSAVFNAPPSASSNLPVYYDGLCDSSALKTSSVERLDLQERKKTAIVSDANERLSKSLIENNILIGRPSRAVALLLDTTPDHPDFYAKAVKASMIAASISSECYQTTMKLLADNLIAVGKIDEGVQFLCLINKSLDACRYLQGAQRWSEAASLAKANLSEDEVKVVFRQWAIHLSTQDKHYQKAVEIFLTLGDFYSVIQLLYISGKFDLASHLIETCYENNIFIDKTATSNHNNQQPQLVDIISTAPRSNQNQETVFSPIPNLTNEFTLEQLIQIIFKEHGNLLHQLSINHSNYYWQKSGKKDPSSHIGLSSSNSSTPITNFDSLI